MRISVVAGCGAVAAIAAFALLAGPPEETTAGVGADAVRYRLLPGTAAVPMARLVATPLPTPAAIASASPGIWATPAEFAPPE